MGGDDGAFYKPETISSFIAQHLQNNCAVSLVSAVVNDPASFGRIVRDKDRVEIIEKEYINEDQKKIHEINTATYILIENG
jgi:bifunctional UDP-N-acetylglucosamine pyrophosphorylase/glucosamine-1-phosphate N-acetyltransferase